MDALMEEEMYVEAGSVQYLVGGGLALASAVGNAIAATWEDSPEWLPQVSSWVGVAAALVLL